MGPFTKKIFYRSIYFVLAVAVSLPIADCTKTGNSKPGMSGFTWPPVCRESRPWTFWWWMGSAVEKKEITRHLKAYRDAGMGGVHIIPIYGAKGYEDKFISYLSPEWMEMLRFTIAEAERLDLGVDMTCGTGWPFGGPWIDRDNAAANVLFETYSLSEGERLIEDVRCTDERHGKDAPLQALMVYSSVGEIRDLTRKVNSTGKLDWIAPPGKWKLYAVFQGRTGQKVKRAAPGAQGNVLDYFSSISLSKYLARFDEAFSAFCPTDMPRSFYHDSYEVYRANWTDDLFAEFRNRRGYDLRYHLPALLDDGPGREKIERVRCDYRETVSDLLLEKLTRPWVDWCHEKGCITRNQAHGSPGNILDLYAAVDIPETEGFGPSGFKIPGLRVERNIPQNFGKPDVLMMKFASSAAHLTGKPLISSETCTWLCEHFQVALSQVKPEIDQLFISGINHVLYHGMTYSPAAVPWPGWRFYATTNFNPTNTFWDDLPALNGYVARCQSFLQPGMPDNDVLLYFPIYDLWQRKSGADEFEDNGEILHYLGVHNLESWLSGTPVGSAATTMQQKGYTFNFVSDRLLDAITTDGEGLHSGKSTYLVLVVPHCKFMPVETLAKLVSLASDGATVIVTGSLPSDVPGLYGLSERRTAFNEKLEAIKPMPLRTPGVYEAETGKGRFLLGDNLEKMLEVAGIPREHAVDQGIDFIRRSYENGHVYFFTNLGADNLDDWLSLGVKAKSAVIFDPLRNRNGLAELRKGERGQTQVRFQLNAGESLILRTSSSKCFEGPRWRYLVPCGEPYEIEGTWEVNFVKGEPEIPEGFKTDKLLSWTETGREKAKVFAGTARYMIEFQNPDKEAQEWILDLGRVHENARVWVNGRFTGNVWCHPFKIAIGEFLSEDENTLEIEVTNLPANRIADMDRRRVPWRIFYDINFVNIQYKPFNASGWPLMPSGLLGPVRLFPHRLAPE